MPTARSGGRCGERFKSKAARGKNCLAFRRKSENIDSFLEPDRQGMVLQRFLARIVRQGTLTLIDGKGRNRRLGGGGKPSCTLRLAPDLREIGLMVNPPLSMAEAYMDGKITVEDGSIGDLLEITLRNYRHLEQHPMVRAARVLGRHGRPQHYNPIGRARQNVTHHYDLSGELYDLFLDSDRQYSTRAGRCALGLRHKSVRRSIDSDDVSSISRHCAT